MDTTSAVTPAYGDVLVAVNGSIESLAALTWAVDYTQTRKLRLKIVTAVSTQNPTSDSSGGYLDTFEKARANAKKQVELAIANSGSDASSYEHIVAAGSIDEVLKAHSLDAHLIVIGTRQQNRWQRWFRPSTTDRLTGTMTCPVLSITLPSASPRPASDTGHFRPEPRPLQGLPPDHQRRPLVGCAGTQPR